MVLRAVNRRMGCVFFMSVWMLAASFQKLPLRPSPVYEKAHLEALQCILETSPKANIELAELKRKYPSHPATFYLDTYKAFVDILAYGKSTDTEGFADKSNAQLARIEALGCPHKSVFACNIYLHLSVSEALRGHNFSAAKYFWKAHGAFGSIPTNAATLQEKQKLGAIFSVAASSVPEQYQWAVGLFASHQGLANATDLLDRYTYTYQHHAGLGDEALLIKALVGLKLSETPSGHTLRMDVDYSQKPVLAYVDGLRALKEKTTDTRIALLPFEVCQRFPPLHYIKGRLMLNALDNSAAQEFTHYIQNYSGASFKTDAGLRLAWIQLLKGNRAMAYKMADQLIAQSPDLPTYADRQAFSELSQFKETVLPLLQARLLYDGGHASQTIDLLYTHTSLALTHPFEYNYRLARAHHDLHNYTKALEHYRLVLKNNDHPQSYFAPYSALMAAKIEFAQGKTEHGRQLVSLCRSLNKGQYKSDIDQQAKRLLEEHKAVEKRQ